MRRLIEHRRGIGFTWGAVYLGFLAIPLLWLSIELGHYARAAGEVQKVADLAALAAARRASVIDWQEESIEVFSPRAMPEIHYIAAANSEYLGQYGINVSVQRVVLNNDLHVAQVTAVADVTPLFPPLPGVGQIVIIKRGEAQFAWR